MTIKPKRFPGTGRRQGRTGQVADRGASGLPVDKGVPDTARRTGGRAERACNALLYASNRHAVLLIFQAMDAAGKDGAIRHVMSGVNPQGCQVFSFKHPSAQGNCMNLIQDRAVPRGRYRR
jgi:hypothetical protein